MELRQYLRDVVLNGVVNGYAWPRRLRGRAWHIAGHQVSSDVLIGARCFVGGWTGLTIGPRAFINHGCTFDLGSTILIGADCRIAHSVMLLTSDHEVGPASVRAGRNRAAPIRVGTGTWIGARATVLAGVTIGSGCVIAAGSVVTSDCAPNGLYAGVPAQRKRDLPVGERAVMRG